MTVGIYRITFWPGHTLQISAHGTSWRIPLAEGETFTYNSLGADNFTFETPRYILRGRWTPAEIEDGEEIEPANGHIEIGHKDPEEWVVNANDLPEALLRALQGLGQNMVMAGGRRPTRRRPTRRRPTRRRPTRRRPTRRHHRSYRGLSKIICTLRRRVQIILDSLGPFKH